MALLACVTGGACGPIILGRENRLKGRSNVPAEVELLRGSAAYRDTIGSLSYYDASGPLAVRGIGLVVGLGTNGSRDCPKAVYDELVQRLYKSHDFSSPVVGTRSITPEELIDDLDTAVVVVQGELPPAAVAGTRFDVTVGVLPGTQTRSLRGGRLFTTELDVFRQVAPSRTLSGQTLARAGGPILVNPFEDGGAGEPGPLSGTVPGGGMVTKDRPIRLVLTQPSHVTARRIQDRLNAHFPSRGRVANATSPSFVELNVPTEYHADLGHFLSLVKALYLSGDPNFEAVRARELVNELRNPQAPHARIALCLEGLGRTVTSVIQELYADSRPYVSFHAGVAGLRLGDHIGADAVALHAENPESLHRFQAIRALGEARDMGSAAAPLRKLLGDADPRVRVAAYEALVQRQDATLGSRRVGGDNFWLDRLAVEGRGLIYAKRSGERRIALFGNDLRCLPPILYRAPDGCITATAEESDKTLTLLRTARLGGVASPLLSAPLEAGPLLELLGNDADVDADGQAIGLGLPYTAVLRLLHHLCESGAIRADFVLEQPNLAELIGPSRPEGRPESEL